MTRKDRTHLTGPGDAQDVSSVRMLTKQEFGQRIYRLMMARGWRQAELARRAGLPRDSISSYVNGKTFPTPLSVQKLAAAFDMKPEEILPNHVAGAISADNPDIELKVSPSDTRLAWLRINKAVSLETGAKIVQLLSADSIMQDNDAPD